LAKQQGSFLMQLGVRVLFGTRVLQQCLA